MQNEPMLTNGHKMKIRKLATNKFPKTTHDEDSVFRQETVRY